MVSKAATPCQALFFLSQFQMVKLQTVSSAGPCRNAVATFDLRATPTRPALEPAAGIREWIPRDRQSGRGHLHPKTSAAQDDFVTAGGQSPIFGTRIASRRNEGFDTNRPLPG